MPMQQTNSNLAARLGARMASANAAVKGKPPNLRPQRLPGGINDGTAKLSTLYIKQQDKDDGMVPKGADFFRGSAIVMSPESHDGQKVAGAITQVLIPLCDVPAKGLRKGKSFEEGYDAWRSILQALSNCPDCPETDKSDPTGQKTQAYWFAVMAALTRPLNEGGKPVYISFSTRSWKPPATAQQPNPEEMVFEEWHGLANENQLNGQITKPNPAAAVMSRPPVPTAPSTPPTTAPVTQMAPRGAVQGLGAAPEPEPEPANLAEEVAALVEIATEDPSGDTPEGVAASERLEELAWAAGWGKAQTKGASDWAAVGEMALSSPDGLPPQGEDAAPEIHILPVGSKHKFCKRTKAGERLKNSKGVEFPPIDVEVISVDVDGKTCTVKAIKDGKTILDIQSKQPVQVKWDWLE